MDAIWDALRALRSNSLRSVLTTLGIIIGVAAVIIMVAVGNGAKQRVESLIQSLGANIMMVIPGSHGGGGVRRGAGTLPSLTEEDAQAIQREIDDVLLAAPQVRGSVQTINGNLNWGTSAYGITPEFLEAREWSIDQGRSFLPQELKGSAKVALLGKTVTDNLFQGQNPLGQTIRIQKVPFLIIGTLAPKGQTPHGMDQDDVVLLPMNTARKRVLGGRHLGGRRVSGIIVKAKNSEAVTRVESQVKDLLRQRHKILPGKEDDFRVRNLAEMLNTQADSSRAMSFLLMSVASVSLLVGGIGIMNIMLVSVTERTREIGLRMAVGATAGEILVQFLIESVVLSLIGGIIGAGLGVTGSVVLASLSQWPAVIDPTSVFLAFGFSALVGIFFGFYPARKASRMDPIDALRYE